MPPVMITGASGFLGHNLIDVLVADGHREIAAIARKPGPEIAGVTWHTADLLEPGNARRLVYDIEPKTIFHLAWCATPGVFWTSPENETWIATTRELGKAAAATGSLLIAAGSCAEYDWTAGGRLEENRSAFAPSTPYGRAKRATHLLLEDIHQRTGLHYAWLRVFWTYGRYEHPDRLVPSVIRGILAGQAVPLTEGRQRIDIVAARDIARAFLAAASSKLAGACDIASGNAGSVRELADAIGRRIGRPELLQFGARPMPAGTTDLVVGMASRLRDEAHWQPQTDLDSGLADAIDWWSQRAG